MRVRCGACRNQFDVAGPGRYACPVCGSVNVVRNGAGAAPGPQSMGGYPAAPGVGGVGAAPPPPPPPPPVLPKIECPECGFGFIVGPIAVATCPNCSAEVPTGFEDESE
jgi:DNA-directed RNA polymerase subunit RPC12/RpoP